MVSNEPATAKKMKRKIKVKTEVKAKRARRFRVKEKKELDPEAASNCIKLSRIPYGFFEKEILKYFSQFGTVSRVRVPRNKKTSNFKGYAYVQFKDAVVAQIAAETMNGYLMFNKIMLCTVLKNNEVPKCLTTRDIIVSRPVKGASTRRNAIAAGKLKTPKKVEQAKKRLIKHIQEANKKFADLGIGYSFDIPVDGKVSESGKENSVGAPAEVTVPVFSSTEQSGSSGSAAVDGAQRPSERKPMSNVGDVSREDGKNSIKKKPAKITKKLKSGKRKGSKVKPLSKSLSVKRKAKKMKGEAKG